VGVFGQKGFAKAAGGQRPKNAIAIAYQGRTHKELGSLCLNCLAYTRCNLKKLNSRNENILNKQAQQ
jgi:hypothetical protein